MPNFFSRVPFVFSALLLFLSAAQAQEAKQLWGRVEVPRGVDPAGVSITLYERPFGEIESDWNPRAEFTTADKGLFKFDYPATSTTELEISGEGLRRARFPWPHAIVSSETNRALFKLNPGAALRGTIADEATGQPIANALIGPIVPGEDVSRSAAENAFPFFVRSSSDGSITIAGVFPNTSYYAQIFAEGYVRRRVHITPDMPFSIRLKEGGTSASGTILGAKSFAPRPGTPVLLMGGPERFYLIRRADEAGRFSFASLPPGEYDIAPFLPDIGALRPLSFTIVESEPVEGLTLYVPEGIRVAGHIIDIETEKPIANARLFIRDASAWSDSSGYFQFNRIEGPFPVAVELAHDQFKFREEDHGTDDYMVSGYGDVDVVDMKLKAHRKRVLEVIRTDESDPIKPGVLELWGPLINPRAAAERLRIEEVRSTFPLSSAGTRLAMLRAPGNFVSDMQLVNTEVEQTTTTLQMELAVGAMLEGSLLYEGEGPTAHPPYTVSITTDADGRAFEPVILFEAQPGQNGRFRLDGLPPGVFSLKFVRPEGALYSEEMITLARGETFVANRAIPRGVVLAGTVLDTDGAPLAQISVVAYGQDARGEPLHLATVTKDDGTFKFEGFGGDQVQQLSIEHYHHAPFKVSNVPLPQEDYIIELHSRAGIEVTVNAAPVLLQDGEVIILFGRQVLGGDGGLQWFYETAGREPLAGESQVSVTPRIESQIRIAAHTGRLWDVSHPIEWTSNSEGVSVNLTPAGDSAILVEVAGSDDESDLTGLDLVLINTTLPESQAVTEHRPTPTENGLLFDRLPASMYMLIASADTAAASISNIDLARGETKRLRVDLSPPSQQLVATVTSGKDRRPAGGARVVLRFGDVPEAEPLMEETANDRGVAVFSSLPGGRPYLVDVATDDGSRRFMVPAHSEPVIQQEFNLVSATRVMLIVSPSLQERMNRQPQVPLIIQGENQSVILRAGQLLEPQPLFPGSYTVYHGEDRIGGIDVPAAVAVVDVNLP